MLDHIEAEQETDHPLNSLAARVHLANAKWWVDINKPCTYCQGNGRVIKMSGKATCSDCNGSGLVPLKRNVGEILMLVVSELAEALEGDRKNLMDDKLPHRKMFEVEIADAFIRLFDICGGFGLDIGGAFEEKMAYNAIRADHRLENRLQENGKKY